MNARKRQQMLRMTELANKYPSFANSIVVSAIVEEAHNEGKEEEIELRNQRD